MGSEMCIRDRFCENNVKNLNKNLLSLSSKTSSNYRTQAENLNLSQNQVLIFLNPFKCQMVSNTYHKNTLIPERETTSKFFGARK